MNAKSIFSDAPYRNKHSLEISHPCIDVYKNVYFTGKKAVLGYRLLFFTEGHIFETIIAIIVILGRHMYLGQISLQPKFGTVYRQDVYFTDQNAIYLGIPL